MTGVAHPFHARQRTTNASPLRLFLFLTSTGLLGFFVAGCGVHVVRNGGGGNGFNDCVPGTACYSSCTDLFCTSTGETGPTDTGTSGTTGSTGVGGCTDAADPSCVNYDPVGFDGGGSGDGGCDPSTCGDPSVGTGDTGGDTGVGDPGGGGGDGGGDCCDGGGDTGGGGDDGGDGGGGSARPGTGPHLVPHHGHVQAVISSPVAFYRPMLDGFPGLPVAQSVPSMQVASRKGGEDEIAY